LVSPQTCPLFLRRERVRKSRKHIGSFLVFLYISRNVSVFLLSIYLSVSTNIRYDYSFSVMYGKYIITILIL
jgi:hypothetical protein